MDIKSVKRYIINSFASALGRIIRVIPQSVLQEFLKNKVFMKYFGWRKLDLVGQTAFGSQMHLTLPDSIQTEIFLTGLWGQSITKFIALALRKGNVFIDIGANIGYYTLLASKLIGPQGKVYAFEASPSIYKRLIANISINKIENVVFRNCAISDLSGKCTIWTPPLGNIGHSTIINNVATLGGHTPEAKVKCDTLTKLMPIDELLSARIIKIDIEGAERKAIQGILPYLNEFSIDTEWIMELSPFFSPGGAVDIEFIFDAFMIAGYNCYLIESDYNQNHNFGCNQKLKLKILRTAPIERLSDVVISKHAVHV